MTSLGGTVTIHGVKYVRNKLYHEKLYSDLPCVTTACCDQSSDFDNYTEAIDNKQVTSGLSEMF